MHYALEIIMSPVSDINAAVEEILLPFSENEPEATCAFWDWWEIGGGYSGRKLEAVVPADKMEAFYAALKEKNVTVSCFTAGKQQLQPASQSVMVDALWRQMCPGAGDVCPIFNHSGKQNNSDICAFADMPPNLTAFRLIIAAPDFNGKKMEAVSMFSKEIWNGVNHEKTQWDGKVSTGVAMHVESLSRYRKEYAEKVSPKPDWIVVTVDYHS